MRGKLSTVSDRVTLKTRELWDSFIGREDGRERKGCKRREEAGKG